MKLRLVGALALAMAFAAAGAGAQEQFPNKPVRVVLAYTGGGPTDFLGRLTGDHVSKKLGQPVLVEPKPGANERVATQYVLSQPADGYTVLLVATPHTTNPSLFKLPYDGQKDLTGLIHLVNIPLMLTVNPSSGINTFADLVKLAKEKPGQVTFGSAGNATSTHLTVELLAIMAGIQLQHIPFKGDAPSITELLGGRVDASSNTITAGLPHVKAGRLKAIGISSRERSKLLPEVPTFIEQGYPEAEITAWFGLIIHAQTPKDRIKVLNAAFDEALRQPNVQEKLDGVGMIPVGGSPEKFSAHIAREVERWGKVIKTRGIRVE